MIHHAFFSDWNLHFIQAEGRCSLLEIVENGLRIAQSDGPEANLDLPGFFDLRAADLVHESADDLRKAVQLRKSLKEKTGNNPCAYVVGSSGSFGNLRMYGIFAELHGLRNEQKTIVTMNGGEAIDWLIEHMGLSGSDAATVRRLLRENMQVSARS